MIAYLLASAVVTLTFPKAEKLDVERLLDAIAQVENWDHKTLGRAGEWGEFGMTPDVWKHCRGNLRKTMQQATPKELRNAAREELFFRITTLEINHHTATAFNAALAWTAGVKATLDGTASDTKRDYARRAESCYEEKTGK